MRRVSETFAFFFKIERHTKKRKRRENFNSKCSSQKRNRNKVKKKQNRNLYSRFIQCNLVFTWSRWKKTVLSLYSSKQIIIYSFFNRSAICWVRQRRCGIYFVYISNFVFLLDFFLFLSHSFAQHEIHILCMLITQPINPLSIENTDFGMQ